MKRILLVLIIIVTGCSKTDWHWYEKGMGAESAGNYEQALKYYQKGVAEGDSLSMSRIALFYKNGQVLPQDDVKALEWYEKSADAGLISSYINIGEAYLHGLGVDKDSQKAIEKFQLAASKGDTEGLLKIGQIYLEGIGVEKDFNKAYEYLQEAIAQGCDRARMQLATMYAKGYHVKQDDTKAVELFKEIINNSYGNEESIKRSLARQLAEIGADYLQGKTVSKNDKKAFYYFNLAVEWGDHGALITLASMYAYGTGTERDIEKAESLFKRALKESDPSAKFHFHYYIGQFYFQAYDPPEYDKAIEYLMKATEDPLAPPKIVASAMHQLSNLYLYEAGNRYDVEKGKQWFAKAVEVYCKEAEEGLPYYMYQLAELYETGLKPTRDVEKALYWYQKAADEGHTDAQIKVEELKNLSPSERGESL